MNYSLQQKLFKKYPNIFRQKDLPPGESCMCWGIDTGDGWYWLIDNLCRQLQRDTGKNNYQIVATQVKEKFGMLRFYVEGATEKQYGAIDLAGLMSASICELCGATGGDVSQTKGYIQTLCGRCKAKTNKEK